MGLDCAHRCSLVVRRYGEYVAREIDVRHVITHPSPDQSVAELGRFRRGQEFFPQNAVSDNEEVGPLWLFDQIRHPKKAIYSLDRLEPRHQRDERRIKRNPEVFTEGLAPRPPVFVGGGEAGEVEAQRNDGDALRRGYA
jgi:hypothetical protein